MKTIILFLFLSLPLVHSAQFTVSGTVTDAKDKSTLPYVNVYVKHSTKGTYTDIQGRFNLTIQSNNAIIVISSIGYAKQEIEVKGNVVLNIALKPLSVSLEETIILPGENPADVIMRTVVEKRDEHDPENLETFQYKSYNKFVIGINKKSLTKTSKDSVDINDSIAVSKRDSAFRNKEKTFEDTLLNEMNLFLMESVTEKKFKKPRKYKETVLASRISGFKDARYVLLGSEFQSFSFYSNYIKILGKEYLSPITKGNTKKYLFILQDTVIEKGEQTYLIYYQPRKGKNFEGLTGLLYINAQNFAVMKATANVADKSSGSKTQVVQYYQKLKGKVYFPTLFTADFFFSGVQVSLADSSSGARNYGPMGTSKTVLYDISLENEFRNREFDNVVLEYAPDALKRDSTFWNKNRQEELTGKDSLTYTMIDSIGEELNLDRRLQFLRILATRKLPIGVFNIHVNDILNFNNFEGIRAGLKASTNDRLSRRFSIRGYYAYGFKDKHSKYGGDFSLFLNKSQSSFFNVGYSSDVSETGIHSPLQYDITDQERIRGLYVSIMDRVERSKASLGFRLFRYVTFEGGVERVNKKVTTAYRFGDGLQQYFKFSNAVASFRWAPGEKLVESFGIYRPKERTNSFELYTTITKGFKGIEGSEFDFVRGDIMANLKFRIRNLGNSYIRVNTGYVDGSVPYTELYFGNAGYNDKNVSLVTPFAFETMRFNEFFGNQYVGIFHRHDFGSLLLRTKKWKPQILLVNNIYFSSLSNTAKHNFFTLKPADKGFFETGIQVNNIYKVNFSGYGLGVFYRYGAYSDANALKNLAFKLNFTFGF